MQQTALRDRVYRVSALTMFMFSASSFALPLCLVGIARELGLNLTQAGSLGFAASIVQFFMLIGSTFLAARFGKIRMLRGGLAALSAGLLLFTASLNYVMAISLILLIGVGSGLLEALLTPIVEDLFPNDNGSKMNLLHAFWPVGTTVAVLTFGFLLSAELNWRWIFAGLALAALLVNLLYPSSKAVALPKSRADFSHMKEIFALPRFWLLGSALAFAGGAEAAFAFWSASYIQIHFAALPAAAGLGTACFAVGMAIGRFGSARLAGRIGLRRLLILSTFVGLLVSLRFFAITQVLSLYLFLFCMGLSVACLWPSLQSFGARELKVDATLLMIFMSCFGIPGYSSATLLMGFIGDRQGLQASFVIAPLYLFMVIVLLSLDRLVAKRQKTVLS